MEKQRKGWKRKGEKIKQGEMKGQGWEKERDCKVGKMMGKGM